MRHHYFASRLKLLSLKASPLQNFWLWLMSTGSFGWVGVRELAYLWIPIDKRVIVFEGCQSGLWLLLTSSSGWVSFREFAYLWISIDKTGFVFEGSRRALMSIQNNRTAFRSSGAKGVGEHYPRSLKGIHHVCIVCILYTFLSWFIILKNRLK